MELITPRLILREFRASDFAALRELEALPETYRYEEANPSAEKTRLQLEQILAHMDDSPRKYYRLAIKIPPREVSWVEFRRCS